MPNLPGLPIEWDLNGGGEYFEPEEVSFLKFLCLTAYREYEPSSLQSFENRIVNWLNNLDDDDDRQAFFGLLLNLFFVGQDEFKSLYKYMYGSIVARWIVDLEGLNLGAENLNDEIASSVNASWICPITDSLRINAFLKVNNLQSMSIRPDWKSLVNLGDPIKISDFTKEHGIERLVLIEDFVGSGTQVSGAAAFASATLPHVQILLSPLIVCPDGNKKLKKLAAKHKNVSYEAAMILPDVTKFPRKEDAKEALHIKCHEIFDQIHERLNLSEHEHVTGFKKTGAQIVMYSNCPNNTLPVYHKDTEDWVSLFHRVERVS